MTSGAILAMEVDRLLEEILAEGPQTFAALVSRLPGVDPTSVRAHLERAPGALRDRVRWSPVPLMIEPSDARLPVPHPLDFDWRFAVSTQRQLAHELAEGHRHAVLLGAPTVWLTLLEEPYGFLKSTLIDRTALPAAGGARGTHDHVVTDLLTNGIPSFPSPADVVLADPPWYPEATKHFVWAAAEVSRLGSRLLLSVAPVGTRPGIQKERAVLFAFAEEAGYTLRETRLRSLVYAMPPFERNALRAAGLIDFVSFDWRRGDLLVFERTRRGNRSRPPCAEETDTGWAERVVGGVRLRVRLGQDEGDDPRPQPLVEGDILSSVSRRDPRRARVRLWTSGNRVFGCAAPSLLLRILDEPELGESPGRVPGAWLREAGDALKAIVHGEQKEYICSEHA
jgi:hypothetical protein